MSFSTGRAAARGVKRRMLRAASTGLPRTSATTIETFRGAMRRLRRCAVDSIVISSVGEARPASLLARSLGDLLLQRVPRERARRRELAELVAHHVLRDE